MRVAWIIFVLIVPVFSGEEPYASLWKKGSENEKKIFLSGLSVGMSLLRNYSRHNLGLMDTAAVDSSCLENWESHIEGAFGDLNYMAQSFKADYVMRTMDRLYEKEANKDLNFQQVYLAALKELKRLQKEDPTRFREPEAGEPSQ